MNRKQNQKVKGGKTLRQKTSKQNDNVREDRIPGPIRLDRFLIQPPRVIVKLAFAKRATLTSAGAGGTSITFYQNGLFDVDPVVGSTATAGFNEWHRLYGVNRVLSTKAHLTVCNQEAFPIVIGHGFLPEDMAAGAFTASRYTNKNCREFILSAKGGQDRRTITDTITTASLLGNPSIAGDLQQFYGTALSNPSTLLSWCLGATSPTAVFTTAGVVYDLRIEFEVEYSDPAIVTV